MSGTPAQTPYAPVYSASAPTSVMHSPDLRRLLERNSEVILHPKRGTIHVGGRHSTVELGRKRGRYSPIIGRLVADTPDRHAWRPTGQWIQGRQQDMGVFSAATDMQPLGVRLMADGAFKAAAEFVKRQDDAADYGWSGIHEGLEVGAEIDVDNVVEHLRVIKMFPELIGAAPMEFHVAKGFRSVPAPFLDFRIAARDPVIGKNFRQGPGTEPQRTQSKFYESFVSCRKDREIIFYHDETRMRATEHDPLEIDRENSAYSLAFKRNLACIMELNQTGNYVTSAGEPTTSSTAGLSSISARTTTGRSENNPLKELQAIITRQFIYNRVRMTKWFMNPITFLHLTQNDYVRSGGEFGRTPVSLPYGGRIQMPTMPGIDIYTDARLPSDRITMTDARQLLWLGEGPKKVRTVDQRIREQMGVLFTDYYDAYNIHRDISSQTTRRFGATARTHSSDR